MKTVGQNQNLLDITVQCTGSLENLFDVAEKAKLSITEELQAGNEVYLEPQRNLIAIMFATNKWQPASSEQSTLDGIGFDDIPTIIY